MLTLEAEWERLSKPQWGLFCIFLKNCLLQILRTSPIKHSSLAQSYVINPNFAGPSAVVKKLITLDASSERGSDSQLSSASVVCLVADGKVDIYTWLPPSSVQQRADLSLLIYGHQMEQPCQHRDWKMKASVQDTLCPQMLIHGRYPWAGLSATLKATSGSYMNPWPRCPYKTVVCLFMAL